jgi:hypothetical protein
MEGVKMQQQSLIRETILEALRDDIDAAGGPKVVGLLLWPEKECPIKAGNHLRNCLSEDRAERLTPEQVMLVIKKAREHGSACTIAFMCDHASLTRPTPIEPEDQRAQLKRQVIQAASDIKHLVERLERLEGGK